MKFDLNQLSKRETCLLYFFYFVSNFSNLFFLKLCLCYLPLCQVHTQLHMILVFPSSVKDKHPIPYVFVCKKYAMLPQHSLEDNKHSNSLRNSRSRMCARINWAKPHCCRSLASKKTRVKKHGYPKKNPHLLEAMTMIGQK